MRRLRSGLNDEVGAVNYLEKLYEVAIVDRDWSDERSYEFPQSLSHNHPSTTIQYSGYKMYLHIIAFIVAIYVSIN